MEPRNARRKPVESFVSVAKANKHAKINEAFAASFKDFDINLPDRIPSSGLIRVAGWNIRHLRIDQNGTIHTLPTVSQGLMFNPDIPGDRERAERQGREKDDRLIAELKHKGLW